MYVRARRSSRTVGYGLDDAGAAEGQSGWRWRAMTGTRWRPEEGYIAVAVDGRSRTAAVAVQQ